MSYVEESDVENVIKQSRANKSILVEQQLDNWSELKSDDETFVWRC